MHLKRRNSWPQSVSALDAWLNVAETLAEKNLATSALFAKQIKKLWKE